MDDVKTFYHERSVIEKEYATKLTTLSNRYFERKAKMSTILSVGENPVITPGSLESASLVAWSEILNQTEQMGKERLRLSNELHLQISEQINGVAARLEDLRRKYSMYHDKIMEDRENFYSDLKKSKSSYDTACEAMETSRLKASKSYDRAKEKATRRMADKEVEMNNEKNIYLIKINVTNRIKDKYYHEDVPELLDHLQALNEVRVRMLNDFWNQAISVEQGCLDRSKTCLGSMSGVVAQNNPGLDSAMFVKHNISQWSEPSDFYFQESPIWHDEPGMNTSDISLQYLRSRLEKAQKRLDEHSRTSVARTESYRNLQEQRKKDLVQLDEGKISKASYIDLMGHALAALQAVTYNETAKTTEAVEIETIEVAAGDKDLNSITPIAETKKRKGILGLLSNGVGGGSIGGVGLSHHRSVSSSHNSGNGDVGGGNDSYGTDDDFDSNVKPMRTMSISSGGGGNGGGSSTTGGGGGIFSSFRNTIRKRSGTNTSSLGGGGEATASSSINNNNNSNNNFNNNNTSYNGGSSSNGTGGGGSMDNGGSGYGSTGKMIYGYIAQQSGEISVGEGEEIMIVEPDDGTGWIIGRKGTGEEGLVPASYLEIMNNIRAVPSVTSVSTTATGDSRGTGSGNNNNNNNSKRKGPMVAPKRGGRKVRYVIALYDYDAATDDDLTIRAGDKIAVTLDDVGDGWTEGELNGMRGSFPTTYVKDVD